jgi:hypothetical protein
MTNRSGNRVNSSLRAALLTLVIGGGLPAAQAFREDEFVCEEAVAYLEECCPDLDAGEVQCVYNPGCSSTTYPSISTSESECIRDKSCDALRAEGVCEKVRARQEAVEDESYVDEEVCQ